MRFITRHLRRVISTLQKTIFYEKITKPFILSKQEHNTMLSIPLINEDGEETTAYLNIESGFTITYIPPEEPIKNPYPAINPKVLRKRIYDSIKLPLTMQPKQVVTVSKKVREIILGDKEH